MTTFIHTMRAMYGLWAREAIVYKREYSRLVSSLVSPILWLVILGTGLSASVELPFDVPFMDYFMPGVLAMTILFMTVFYGLYIVWDRKMDVLKAVLVAPVARPVLFVGKVLGGTTQGLVEGVLFLVIAWPLVRYDLSAIPGVLLFILMLGVALTALGLALGSFFESFEGFQIVSSFLVFPMFFLSGAMYTLDGLPGWLDVATKLNPLTYGVDALRGLLLEHPEAQHFPLMTSFLVLAGFTVAMMIVGAWSFNRMKQ